jgi:DNA replication and repair protein RecF
MCYVTPDFSAEQLSTGEQKTIVLLLILAQCNYLVNECKLNPVILMDEICSHLDANNRSVLLKLSQEFDLQIFMTGTEKNLFSFLSTNTNYYNITN